MGPAGEGQPAAVGKQLLLAPEREAAAPDLVVDDVEQTIELAQPPLRWVQVEGAEQAQHIVMARPGQRQRVGSPCALDRHGDLVLADTVEVPTALLGQGFDNVDRVNIGFR
jgi:nucleotide-binding universal stress UspA family protein